MSGLQRQPEQHAQAEESAEKIADLPIASISKNEASEVKGGTTSGTASAPSPPPKQAFEIKDWSF